jgi:hypothetical protein
MRFHRLIAAASILSLAAHVPSLSAQAPSPTPASIAARRDSVTRTALDYLEGFYEGDTAKIARAFRPDLWKYGFFRDSTKQWKGERMTFDEALAYAKRVKARNRPVNPAWPKKVELFEVLERTASVKVTAWWGTDYLLIGNFDGKWMISSVLWEDPAPEVGSGARSRRDSRPESSSS